MDGWMSRWVGGWYRMDVPMDGQRFWNLTARPSKFLKKKGEHNQVSIYCVFHFWTSDSKGTRLTSPQTPTLLSPSRTLFTEVLSSIIYRKYSEVKVLNICIQTCTRYHTATIFSRDISRKTSHHHLKYCTGAKALALTWRWVHSVFTLLTPTNWSKSVIQVKQPLVIGFSVLQSHIAKA